MFVQDQLPPKAVSFLWGVRCIFAIEVVTQFK